MLIQAPMRDCCTRCGSRIASTSWSSAWKQPTPVYLKYTGWVQHVSDCFEWHGGAGQGVGHIIQGIKPATSGPEVAGLMPVSHSWNKPSVQFSSLSLAFVALQCTTKVHCKTTRLCSVLQKNTAEPQKLDCIDQRCPHTMTSVHLCSLYSMEVYRHGGCLFAADGMGLFSSTFKL